MLLLFLNILIFQHFPREMWWAKWNEAVWLLYC